MFQNSVVRYIIFLCLIFSLLVFIFPDLIKFWVNRYFYVQQLYHIWILQFFSSQFIHGSVMHILFNCIGIYYFWSIVEKIIWSRCMLVFFISCSICLGLFITFMSSANTVWLSGFVMAVLAFYAKELHKQKNSEFWGVFVFLLINIALGFMPWISFIGHFLWAVYGFLFWSLREGYKKYI